MWVLFFQVLGADGSNGLNAIKANGGICIAQDPSTAGSDGYANECHQHRTCGYGT